MPYPIATNNTKYWGAALTKQVKTKMTRTLSLWRKKVEEKIRKWKYLPWSCIGRIKIIKMTTLPKAIYRFNAFPIKTIKHRTKKKYSNPHWKIKNTRWLKQFCIIKELSETSPSLTSSSTIEPQFFKKTKEPKPENSWTNGNNLKTLTLKQTPVNTWFLKKKLKLYNGKTKAL